LATEQGFEAKIKRSQILSHLIVQLASDAPSLLFLRVKQLATQGFAFCHLTAKLLVNLGQFRGA